MKRGILTLALVCLFASPVMANMSYSAPKYNNKAVDNGTKYEKHATQGTVACPLKAGMALETKTKSQPKANTNKAPYSASVPSEA